MENYENAVFISYAWGGESEEVANKIDGTLQQRGIRITPMVESYDRLQDKRML